MAKSTDIKQDGSIFTAYTQAVKSHQDVRDLYVKIKMLQPAARHVVCAYWVEHPEEYYALDYHDDEEHGAGRLLMDFLKVNELKNRVIFVARRYGGARLGMDRFQCYLSAALGACNNDSFNTILNIEQRVLIQDPRKVKHSKLKDAEWKNFEQSDFQEETEDDINELRQKKAELRRRGSPSFTPRNPNGTIYTGRGQSHTPIRAAVPSTQSAYNRYAKQGELMPRMLNFPTLQFNAPNVQY